MRRLVAILLLLLVPALAACGSKDDGKPKKPAAGEVATAPAGEVATAPAGSPPVGANGCQQVQAPPAKQDGGAKKPKGKLAASKTWTLEVRTSCGLFTIALDLKAAPNAAASMVSLARAGFFKQTVFHRIAPGFVIQGGDPTGTGTGGPGYSTVDKPPRNARYTLGVVAMAKTEQEPPGTAGSQFYVVTGPDAGLPPDYAIIGRVTKGLSTVKRIGMLGDQSEQPTQPVVIYDITARGA
jgi:cyclophilin family peptidyl-prolyl cis-trans isomerase